MSGREDGRIVDRVEAGGGPSRSRTLAEGPRTVAVAVAMAMALPSLEGLFLPFALDRVVLFPFPGNGGGPR
eukprot:12409625-Karenia_brevis.AAC.1